jgi:hypothetical protein
MDRVFIQGLLQIHQVVQEQESPNGQGIDQHSTWFHIGRDGLSSTEGDGSGC